MNDNSEFSVVSALIAAGWFPGRSVEISALEQLETGIFPAARTVLQEFYGLHIGNCGPGKECATSDVLIDPLTAVHIVEELPQYEQVIGVRLFPLGEVHRGHGFVLIDEEGRIYLLDDDLMPFARSFAAALEKFVQGRLPDRDSNGAIHLD